MAIARWEPFRDLLSLQDRMHRLFEDVLTRSPTGTEQEGTVAGQWTPAVDIFETEEHIIIRAEVPGIDQSALDVEVKDDRLILQGERQFEEAAGRNYHRVERAYGGFRRVFSLPVMVQQDRVRAVLKNGVLEITLPKEDKGKPKQVQVEIQ